MTPTPIYLQIHYQLTKRAIAEHIHKYNDAIEKEWRDNIEAFRKKHSLEEKQTYRCLTIKASVEATVFGILDMYAKFLQSNENTKCTNPVFKITNKGVRTKRHGLLDVKTVWEHRKRITAAGIFDENKYVYHGTNSGFEIGFNPSVLVACMNQVYTEMIVNNYCDSVEKTLITPQNLTLLGTIRPLFSEASNGYMVTNCNHIIVPVQLQELNINMGKERVVENNLLTQIEFNNSQILNGALAPARTKQEHGSINKKVEISLLSLNFKHLATEKQEQAFRPREIEKAAQSEDMNILRFHVASAMKLILNVLYKDKFVSESDIKLATKDLQQYFSRKAAGKTILELSDDLWLAVMEAYKSNRRTGFTPAPLHKYLDVYFKGGLLSTTLVHVENYVKPYIAKNKDITDSIKATNHWYQAFVKSENNSDVYRRATQNLNKKKNKAYLDFFNEAVVEHKNFDKQIIYQTLISQ